MPMERTRRQGFLFSTARLAAAVVAAAAVLAASHANAATYTGQVLYSFSLPSGYASGGFAGFQYANGGNVLLYGSDNGIDTYAFVATPPSGTESALSPAGGTSSAEAVRNGTEVGSANNQAALWTGSASSVAYLANTGFSSSIVYGFGNGQYVGSGVGADGSTTPLFWDNAADAPQALAVATGDLAGIAINLSGNQIVGQMTTSAGLSDAALWTAPTGAPVDLTPSGDYSATADATDGTYQVGTVNLSRAKTHAAIWNGSADTVRDLNPTGFASSAASDIGDGSVVGDAQAQGAYTTAALWDIATGSFTDLGALLPAGLHNTFATTIDANGDIWGVGDDGQQYYALEWTPVPEPASLTLLGLTGLLALRRRA